MAGGQPLVAGRYVRSRLKTRQNGPQIILENSCDRDLKAGTEANQYCAMAMSAKAREPGPTLRPEGEK